MTHWISGQKARLGFSVALLLGLLAVVIVGCQGEEDALPNDDVEILEPGTTFTTTTEIAVGGMYVPSGTVVTARSGGFDFVFPDQALYYYMDIEGNIRTTKSGGVKCTCTQGAGCDPARVNGNYVCVIQDGCTQCVKEPAFDFSSTPKPGVRGGFLDTRRAIEVVATGNEPTITKLEFPEFWTETEVFGKAYQEFLRANSLEKSNPDIALLLTSMHLGEEPFEDYVVREKIEHTTFHVTAFGISSLITVFGTPENSTLKSNAVKASSLECSCSSGGTGCKKKSVGPIVYCDSSPCTSCILREGF
ncbi:MAG: hypothetical protein SFY70_10650 [Bacteroidia bacterium]|nr:hypothetical protein [Bacteroidia bacterium]